MAERSIVWNSQQSPKVYVRLVDLDAIPDSFTIRSKETARASVSKQKSTTGLLSETRAVCKMQPARTGA